MFKRFLFLFTLILCALAFTAPLSAAAYSDELIYDTATIETNYGDITFEFYKDKAPENTKNFQELVKADMYDNAIFHRVIDDFVIQGGDFENRDGTGGYSYLGPDIYVEDEFDNGLTHERGVVSMANAGPGTTGSQFFIVQKEDGADWLDGNHSIFGKVTEGMDVVDEIAAVETDAMDAPVEDVVIEDIVLSMNDDFYDNMSCFNDVSNDHPYLWSIIDLSEEGVIVGYGDGSFHPEQKVTRAEFLKMTLMYLGTPESIYSGLKGCFDDTEGHWAEEIICFGHNNQIVEGDGADGLFHPDRDVNFAEAAKIMTFVNGIEFEDYIEWYEGPVSFLENSKTIPQTVQSLDKKLTRSEVAEILYRMEKGTRSTDLYVDGILDGEAEVWEYINPEFVRQDGVLFDGDGNYLDLEWLTDEIAVDSVNVYYISDLGFAGVVPGISTLELIVPDSHRLFYETIDEYEMFVPTPVIYADHIRAGGNSYILVNSDWFDGKGNHWREAINMEGADLEFEKIGDSFAILTIPNEDDDEVSFIGKHHIMVGDRVFYLNNEIKEVDADSFAVYMQGTSFSWLQIYSHDDEHVYVRGEAVEGADPDSFGQLSSGWYYTDDQYLFSNDGDNLGSKAGLETYVDNINFFAKTDAGVFIYGNELPGADPETFEYDSMTKCGKDSEKYFLPADSEDYYPEWREVTEEEWGIVCEM